MLKAAEHHKDTAAAAIQLVAPFAHHSAAWLFSLSTLSHAAARVALQVLSRLRRHLLINLVSGRQGVWLRRDDLSTLTDLGTRETPVLLIPSVSELVGPIDGP